VTKNTIDQYSKLHRDDAGYGDLKNFAKLVVTHCGLGKMLVIGCHEGSFVGELLKLCVDAFGIDFSEKEVECANQRFNGRFHHISTLDFPFKDMEFDTVVVSGFLEYLLPEDIETVLQEICRVSRRFVFLQIATVQDASNQRLTVKGRAWWEKCCINIGLRKHPSYYRVNDYEALNSDGDQIYIVLEKVPENALKIYPIEVLAEERNLHMDMLREVGKRSDAHVVRYKWASSYIRQGDRVLDAACGLGYGSYAVTQLSKARSATGIDGSDYGIAYANHNFANEIKNIDFLQGYLPDCLSKYEDGQFDVVICFETLEHVKEPEALLKEFYRLLSPGGRIIVSVPNDWSDESGEDPNPFHLHVYTLDKLKNQMAAHFIPEALVQQIASSCKVDKARNIWEKMPRTFRPLAVDCDTPPPSEWWLMVGLKDPVKSTLSYRESVYGYTTPPDHLLQFERDYRNPWLVRTMLEFHFRATDKTVLRQLADEVLEYEKNALCPDCGAALAVIGYQLLNDSVATSNVIEDFLGQIAPYISTKPCTHHLYRFYISHAFLSAQLLKKIGHFDAALKLFNDIANADVAQFSPSLGVKVIDSAFEAGMLNITCGDISAARNCWKLGVERAYSLLSSPLAEFVGELSSPHEFPTIYAVEFLDSAVRCVKALRVTEQKSCVPITRLYDLTRENWKGMLEECQVTIQSMETMIRERDKIIHSSRFKHFKKFASSALRPLRNISKKIRKRLRQK
jgi:ubiquinone/menaquinone biosynthesis C-methylase UbiE